MAVVVIVPSRLLLLEEVTVESLESFPFNVCCVCCCCGILCLAGVSVKCFGGDEDDDDEDDDVERDDKDDIWMDSGWSFVTTSEIKKNELTLGIHC